MKVTISERDKFFGWDYQDQEKVIFRSKGVDIIIGEHPPGVFFEGSQIFGQKNKGSQILRGILKGSQINFKVWPNFFSKSPLSWKLLIQISQKLLQFQRSKKPIK